MNILPFFSLLYASAAVDSDAGLMMFIAYCILCDIWCQFPMNSIRMTYKKKDISECGCL